jgi:hypothetical protein
MLEHGGRWWQRFHEPRGENMKRFSARAFALAVALSLSACGGGGGGDSSGGQPEVNASFAGIWTGETVSTATGARIKVNGVALPSGEALFFAYVDGHVFNGSYTVSGSTVSLTATAQWKDYMLGATEAFSIGWDASAAFPKLTQTLTASGALSSRASASLTYSASLGDSGSLGLTYWNIYDRTSALTKLAGTYSNGPGLAVTINADGTFTGTDRAATGFGTTTRRYSGQFTVLDASKNLYGLRLVADGVAFNGYAFMSDSAVGKVDDAIQLAAVQSGWGPFVHYWVKQ